MVKCANESLYTGITTNIERRLEEHNGVGKSGAKYTRAHRPVVLAYVESCSSRSDATKREHEIKQLTRLEKIRLSGANLDS